MGSLINSEPTEHELFFHDMRLGALASVWAGHIYSYGH